MSLLRVSRQCTDDARRHRIDQDLERRAARALVLVQMVELSAGREALEGTELAQAPNRHWSRCVIPTADHFAPLMHWLSGSWTMNLRRDSSCMNTSSQRICENPGVGQPQARQA